MISSKFFSSKATKHSDKLSVFTHGHYGPRIPSRANWNSGQNQVTVSNLLWAEPINVERHDPNLYEVVSSVELQTECPVCQNVLKDPCVISCPCGKKICRRCVEEKKPCPICEETDYTFLRDYGLEKSLKGVCCYKRRSGSLKSP